MVIFNSYVSLPEGIAFQIPVTGHRWISLAAAAVADTLRFGRNYLGNWKTSVLVLSSSLPMVGNWLIINHLALDMPFIKHI